MGRMVGIVSYNAIINFYYSIFCIILLLIVEDYEFQIIVAANILNVHSLIVNLILLINSDLVYWEVFTRIWFNIASMCAVLIVCIYREIYAIMLCILFVDAIKELAFIVSLWKIIR
jgi:hypothetical protein